MLRALGSLAIALGLLLGPIAVAPVAASIPQGAITWKVDHTTQTITVSVKLEIYSACDSCPGAVNQLLADKMKAQILDVWNAPIAYQYRCYKLVFEVDVKIGTNRFGIDGDRVGVRIDNSPVDIRSHVSGVGHSKDRWRSNDPADKLVPTNDVLQPTTWRESGNRDTSNVYAHEFGHVMGLSDAYEDQPDPADPKKVKGVPLPGAPLDLMSTMDGVVSQETINRLIERSPIDRAKLRCNWLLDVDVLLHRESPGYAYVWDDTLKARKIYLSSSGGRVFGSGPVSISVTWSAAPGCSSTYKRTQTLKVDGSRQGDDLVLRFEIPDSLELVTVTCPKPVGSFQTGEPTSATIWAETLGEVRLPSAGGPKSAAPPRTKGTITNLASGEFTVTVVPPQ